jgi:hypothetical protein
MQQITNDEAKALLKKKVNIHVVRNKLAAPIEAVERKSQGMNPMKWVPWFNSRNDFARDMLEKVRVSPTSARILHDKVVYTLGNSFIVEGQDAQIAQDYFNEVNAEGDTMHELLARLAKDYYFLGNAFLEVVKIGSRINLGHLDASSMLVAKPDGNTKGFYFSRDWQNYLLPEFTPLFLPAYPAFGKIKGLEGERAVIHIRNYHPGYFYYGLPDFYAAYYAGWMNIDYHIPKYNENRFENQFRPSGMLLFSGQKLSKEEEKKLIDKVEGNWSGEGNNSSLIIISAEDPSLVPKYIPFNDAPEGAFRELQKLATENLITAHNWHPALLLQQPGKLSNATDIQTAFELISTTYISPNRNLLLAPILKILRKEMGLAIDKMDVRSVSPVSFFSQLDPKQVLSVEEQRSVLGFDSVQ